MSKSTINNFILVLISLIIIFSFCELIVRLFIPVRSVGLSFTVYDPMYGKRLKKNFSTTRVTPEFKISFSTNSYGFRGPELPSHPSRPILFFGDSFTMGYGVNDGEEFPSLIREALAEQYGTHVVPVINTGMGDNGNGRWIKFLRSEGKFYNPRLVILQLLENDFRDNLDERLFELSSNNELRELPVPPISKTRIIQNFVDKIPGLSNSHLFGLVNQVRWLLAKKPSASPSEQTASSMSYDKGDHLTYLLLEEVIAKCDYEGWPMLALIIDIDGHRLRKLKLLLQEKKVPIIRLPSKKVRPDLYYTIDGHWNSRGHSYASELIMGKLREYSLGVDRKKP